MKKSTDLVKSLDSALVFNVFCPFVKNFALPCIKNSQISSINEELIINLIDIFAVRFHPNMNISANENRIVADLFLSFLESN